MRDTLIQVKFKATTGFFASTRQNAVSAVARAYVDRTPR